MSEFTQDLRTELRKRLQMIVSSYAKAMSQYNEKREDLERDYRASVAELERERTALEELLAIEEKRCSGLELNPDKGKTARLLALDELQKTVAA